MAADCSVVAALLHHVAADFCWSCDNVTIIAVVVEVAIVVVGAAVVVDATAVFVVIAAVVAASVFDVVAVFVIVVTDDVEFDRSV